MYKGLKPKEFTALWSKVSFISIYSHFNWIFKSNQNYKDHQHCKKEKKSPRVCNSAPSVFWSPDVKGLLEMNTLLEGGEKDLMLLL